MQSHNVKPRTYMYDVNIHPERYLSQDMEG